LFLVALSASAAQAPPTQTTRVYAVAARYSDTSSNGRGPGTLQKILRTVRDFYAEGSGGRHEFVADVHPVTLELPQARPPGRCRLPDGATLSQALRDAGISLTGYHALVLVVPASTQGCAGGVQTAFRHVETDGARRAVPLAVSWSYTGRFVAHEIVHTHGIGHAKALACRAASIAADCTTKEYGNIWDLMGNGSSHMLSAPLRTRMGWIEPIVHDGGSASYTIGAATRPGGLPTAVRVPLPFTGDDAVQVLQPLSLWIEYRAPFGFDKGMDRPSLVNFAQGAMVNVTGVWRGTKSRNPRTVSCPAHSPCVLDTTRQTGTFKDAGLPVGQTWTEPFTGTRIAVDSRTETTLTITVSVP
jgi:hypothetical protein